MLRSLSRPGAWAVQWPAGLVEETPCRREDRLMAEKQHIKLGVVVFDELSVEAYFNSGGQRPP